jgi:hypothetical protein
MMFADPQPILQHIRAGKARALPEGMFAPKVAP